MKLNKHTRNTSSKVANSNKKTNHEPLQQEIKGILQSLNKFLKKYFHLSTTTADLDEYKQKVKQFFIDHSTKVEYSCAVSSLFSKLANMLQPFLQILSTKTMNISSMHENMDESMNTENYHSMKQIKNMNNHSKSDLQWRCDNSYELKCQIGTVQAKNVKLMTKINKLKEQLNNYKIVSTRLTNFMYLLRLNNIDVDSIYEKGCVEMENKAGLQARLENQRPVIYDQKPQSKYENYMTN